MTDNKVYLYEGISELVDQDNNKLLTVQLTSLSFIVRDTTENTLLDVPRVALKWLDHGQKGELPQPQAEEKEVPPPLSQGFFSA